MGKDRTEVIKNLALQGGSFPGIFTPEEVTQQAEEKKARRAAVMEQIIQGKGQLTLGGTLMALGQGISKGGGIEIGKALEKMTDELMAERKDLSKLEAQNLLANLDIDELAIDTIRKLPKQMQLILAARKKAKEESEYMKQKTEKLKREGGSKPLKGAVVSINTDDPRYKIYSKQIGLLGESYAKVNPEIGKVLQDLDNKTLQLLITQGLTLRADKGNTISPEEAIKQAVIEAIGRYQKTDGKELGREGFIDTIIQKVF